MKGSAMALANMQPVDGKMPAPKKKAMPKKVKKVKGSTGGRPY
jgi:hypothetical protein